MKGNHSYVVGSVHAFTTSKHDSILAALMKVSEIDYKLEIRVKSIWHPNILSE